MSYFISISSTERELFIDEFHGGMTNAFRRKDVQFSRFIANLDPLSIKNRLSHMAGMAAETFDTGLSASGVKLCQYISINDRQYGLGVVDAQDYVKIFEKSTPAGSWAASTTGESASGTRSETLFVEYQGNLYGARNGTAIWRWNYGTPAFTEVDRTLATAYRTTTPNQTAVNPIVGIRFKKDDILYIGYDNILIRKNGSTWTDPVLTFPTDEIISSLAEYGNYLAISTRPRYRGGRSNLYLWDRDSSIATLSEKVDWGYEGLEWIEELEGYLIGMSTLAVAGTNNLDTRIIFKSYIGGTAGAKYLFDIPISSLTINLRDSGLGDANAKSYFPKQKQNNRVYFMMTCSILNAFGTSTQRDGIWAIGRTDDGNFVLYLDRLLNNDTAITNPRPKGFQLHGDWVHVAYTNDGTFVANRTRNSDVYGAGTGTYETLILNFGDSDLTKQIKYITLTFEPLPASSTIALAYAINAETSYTQIFSHTTQNDIQRGAINITSSGAHFPKFKELKLRIQITGTGSSVALTGMKIKVRIIDDTLS